MKWAVFLDRDGTIIKHVNYLSKKEDIRLLPHVGKTIKTLNDHGIPVIVVTNQPVVARGYIPEKYLEVIHEEISKRLARFKAKIDYYYYCPHHPNADLINYRIACNCRKPAIDLFLKAAKEFNLSLADSFVIGDTFRDIEAGKKTGSKTIAVESGTSDFKESIADFKVKNLNEAIKLVLSLKKC